jgi:hypothetical protein
LELALRPGPFRQHSHLHVSCGCHYSSPIIHLTCHRLLRRPYFIHYGDDSRVTLDHLVVTSALKFIGDYGSNGVGRATSAQPCHILDCVTNNTHACLLRQAFSTQVCPSITSNQPAAGACAHRQAHVRTVWRFSCSCFETCRLGRRTPPRRKMPATFQDCASTLLFSNKRRAFRLLSRDSLSTPLAYGGNSMPVSA